MITTYITSVLQDLIFRLQNAEKGYQEISKATNNSILQNWLIKYANERHEMHSVLGEYIKSLGDKDNVKTSFLGGLHKMFVDIKINNIDDDFDSILKEIQRGSIVLVNDYDKVLSSNLLYPDIRLTLMLQKKKIKSELYQLNLLQEKLNAVEA